MKLHPTLRPFPVLAGLLVAFSGAVVTRPHTVVADEIPATRANATARVIAAANAFLATLDDAGRAKAVFAADDAAQIKNWFVPTAMNVVCRYSSNRWALADHTGSSSERRGKK